MRFSRLILISTLGIIQLNAACGSSQKKGKSNNLPAPSKYFVHGNPDELLLSTSADNSGLVTFDTMESLNNYAFSTYSEYEELIDRADIKAIGSQEELEKENSTNREPSGDSDSSNFQNNYSFVIEGESILYKDARAEAVGWPVFTFVNEGGKLTLLNVDGETVEPIHYSIKSDNSAFSILFRTKSDLGTKLTSATFLKARPQKKTVRWVGGPNNYFILGDGYAVSWNRDITINVCGKNAVQYKPQVDRAMADWSKSGDFEPGYIGKNKYTVELTVLAKPFNDLNQNCVIFVETYRLEESDRYFTQGVAVHAMDSFNYEFMNTTVFIYLNAMAKTRGSLYGVVTHELGHLLGLGHEFSTAGKTALRSIMGYDDVSTITDADKLTIKNLYPSL